MSTFETSVGAFGVLPDHVATALHALVPEKSHDPAVQHARLVAAALYKLVGQTSPGLSATQTIAGALREFALHYIAAEKAHVLQEAKARTSGEVAEIVRALDAARDRLQKIVQP